MAVVRNQFYHFGVGAPPILEPFLVVGLGCSLGVRFGFDPRSGPRSEHPEECTAVEDALDEFRPDAVLTSNEAGGFSPACAICATYLWLTEEIIRLYSPRWHGMTTSGPRSYNLPSSRPSSGFQSLFTSVVAIVAKMCRIASFRQNNEATLSLYGLLLMMQFSLYAKLAPKKSTGQRRVRLGCFCL